MEKKSAGRKTGGIKPKRLNAGIIYAGETTINKLRKENTVLKSVLDLMNTGIYLKNAKSSKYVYWNGKLSELTEIKTHEILGKNDRQIFGNEKAVQIREQDAKVINKNNPSEFSGNILLKEGTEKKHLSVFIIPVKPENDKTDYLLGIVRDITAEINNERKLNSKENLLRKIIKTSSGIIYVYDTVKKKNTLYGSRITEILGYKPDYFKKCRENLSAAILHPDDKKKYQENILPLLQKITDKKCPVSHVRFKVKGKKEYKNFIEQICLLEKSESGAAGKILFVLNDITDLLNKENAIKTFSEKFNLFEQVFNAGFWQYDIAGEVSEWSEGINRIFDIKSTVKTGNIKKFLKFIPPDEKKHINKLKESVIKGNSEEITHRIKTSAGKEKYLLTAVKPVPDEYGKTIKVLGTSMEITEKVESELKLKKISDELQRLNTGTEKFYSIVAHDFRGPFTGLLGYTESLDNEFSVLSRSDIHNYIKTINKALKTVYNTIENLLQWSKIQRGKLLFNPEKVDLHIIAESVIGMLKSDAVSKNINIINDIKKESIVFADDNMMRSVLNNLLSNSIKFCNEGGSIIFSAEDKNNFYEISVSDTGIGMKPEFVRSLFKIELPYVTLGTRNEKGSGLGLLLCNEFIQRHNSKLHVNSEEGIGTTVYFKIKKSR
jgi:PAS domain S-box-containing protein